MIKVNKNGNVIKITGHSGYDNAGKDIVCASVSSIIYTTVNGLLNINEKSIEFLDNDEYMEIKVLLSNDITNSLILNTWCNAPNLVSIPLREGTLSNP